MDRSLVSDNHVRAVIARADASDRPWAPALVTLRDSAEKALGRDLVCVRDNGGSPHYRVDAIYVPGRDGVVNPESNMVSRELAGTCGRTCFNLALAWRFTGDARYADRALRQIHAWCIDEDTRMFPAGRVEDPFTPGARHGGDITVMAVFTPLLLAGHLLNGYEGWDLRAHAAVRHWVRDMIEPQRRIMFFQGQRMYNNWDDARNAYLAAGALMLDDLDLLIESFEQWTRTLPLKMTDDGELPRETMRTRSMTYTTMALWHTLEVAAIANRYGINLFDLTVNGKGIRKAVDYATHYLLNIDDWPFSQITPLNREHPPRLGLFEIAYSHWGDPRYLEVIETWGGRPVSENHATLLYADPHADA